MAFSRRSARRLSSAGEERKLVRVVIVEQDPRRRALLSEDLSRQGFAVQGLSDEQVLLASGALRQADVIVLGRTRSIASVPSLSARLSDAPVRVPIVNLTGGESARAGSDEVVYHVGSVLRIADMLRDLERLVQAIRQQPCPPRRDVVRGAVTLRQDGATLWNDVEVPLTPYECVIVNLLVRTSPQFVSCDMIYGLGHVGSDAVVTDENRRRTSVRLAVSHIRRKFRDCDPAFRAIQSHRGLGYVWNDGVCPAATADQVIH
jgi:DNA-binding response OmpR family regulator